MHTDICAIAADRNIVLIKRKKAKIQEFMYRDATNLEHEICDYTGKNLSYRNSNKRFKENPVTIP